MDRVRRSEERKHRILGHTCPALVEKVVALVLQDERKVAPSPHARRTYTQSDGVRLSEGAISGRRNARTWNNDRWLLALDPIVRRDVARILDRDVFGCRETRRRGNRLDDPGRVQAFLDVGPGWGAASSCPKGIAKVRPETHVAASWIAYEGTNVSMVWLVARHWVKNDCVFTLRGIRTVVSGCQPVYMGPIRAGAR